MTAFSGHAQCALYVDQMQGLPYACIASILDTLSIRRTDRVVAALHGAGPQRLLAAVLRHLPGGSHAADSCGRDA